MTPPMIRLTVQDVAAAQSLHLARFLRRRLTILSLLTLCFLVLGLVPQINPTGGGQLLRLGMAAALAAGLILALPKVLPPLIAPRLMRKHAALSRPFRVVPEEGGLAFHSEEGDWITRWPDLLQLVQDGRVLLVYASPVLFHILPKRAYSAEDLARIERLFAQSRRS